MKHTTLKTLTTFAVAWVLALPISAEPPPYKGDENAVVHLVARGGQVLQTPVNVVNEGDVMQLAARGVMSIDHQAQPLEARSLSGDEARQLEPRARSRGRKARDRAERARHDAEHERAERDLALTKVTAARLRVQAARERLLKEEAALKAAEAQKAVEAHLHHSPEAPMAREWRKLRLEAARERRRAEQDRLIAARDRKQATLDRIRAGRERRRARQERRRAERAARKAALRAMAEASEQLKRESGDPVH